MSEFLVVFLVKGANNLPKTDTFSAIDPFVRVTTCTGQVVETKRVQDNSNPSWNDCFILRLPAGSVPGTLGGHIDLALLDEDPLRNQEVGGCRLDFSEFQSLEQMR